MLLGVGIGAAETVSNELILSSAPPAKAGAASAVSETAYELGAVLGTAVLGSILAAQFRTGIELPSILTGAQADAARETLAGAVTVAEGLPAPIGADLVASAAAAFDGGVVVTSLIGVALMVAAAIIAAIALRNPCAVPLALSRPTSLNGRTAAVLSQVGGRSNDAQRAVGSSGVECSLRTTRSPVAGSTLVCEVVTERRLRARKTMPKITTTTPAIMRM